MKTLKEVCELVGVSRRTLQGYNAIGLLSPTRRTDGGYWQYDNLAITRLMLIQVFVEAGYKRKEIKNILELPQEELAAEMERATEKLEHKKGQIEKMISTMRVQTGVMQQIVTLPDAIQNDLCEDLVEKDIGLLYRNKSFKKSIQGNG